jgi:hypothetical protein
MVDDVASSKYEDKARKKVTLANEEATSCAE